MAEQTTPSRGGPSRGDSGAGGGASSQKRPWEDIADEDMDTCGDEATVTVKEMRKTVKKEVKSKLEKQTQLFKEDYGKLQTALQRATGRCNKLEKKVEEAASMRQRVTELEKQLDDSKVELESAQQNVRSQGLQLSANSATINELRTELARANERLHQVRMIVALAPAAAPPAAAPGNA